MAIPNGVVMQYFHWSTPAAGSSWRELGAPLCAGGVLLPH
jgi:hypothetical protein